MSTSLPRCRPHALCLAFALLLLPGVTSGQEQRAVLELVVNGVPKGEALVELRGADVIIEAALLRAAGVRTSDGVLLSTGAEETVSLTALAPGITFSVNERDLRLVITASPELLGENVRDFRTGAPRDLVYRSDGSGFVNYSLTWGQASGAALFTESAARVRNALLYNTVALSGAAAIRGLTSVTIDERPRMRRWIFGDGFAQAGPLGGDAWMGGITVTRDFGIEPYFVRHPSLSISTPVAVPSVVEVHVNGRIVSQERVAPGRLDMRNLPLTVGRNDAQVVVRDAFGGSREISTSYYLASSALAPGVHDYQYSLGFRRQALGSRNWDYRAPVALARHRIGLTDTITVGGRLEMASRLVSGGPSVNLQLFRGELEGAAAASAGGDGSGAALLVGYTYAGRPVSAGASIMKASDGYATVNARPRLERPSTEGSVFASVSMGRWLSLTAQHSQASLQSGMTRTRSALLAAASISRNVQVSVTAARGRDENGRGRDLFAGVSVLFGRASAAVSAVHTSTGGGIVVEGQQPMPVGTGYGFHARAQSGSPGSFTGAARYQGRHGRYELRRDVIGGRGETTTSVMGAIVAIGGGLYASRPVQDSFALVRVPGVGDVRGYLSHQEIGRTDAKGNLLVPDLQPYYGNLLNIADSDVPLQYAVAGVRLTLALPYRGGALAVFPVQFARRVIGAVRVTTGSEERIPEYGEMLVTIGDGSEPVSSPIGTKGDFYFENLPGGRHRATVRDQKGSCAFILEIPSSDEPIVNLGALRCALEESR